MAFSQQKKPYGRHTSWRSWRNANASRLSDAGVPTVALESEWNWGFFLQEADPTLMGGPPFCVQDLADRQIITLNQVLDQIREQARGGDLFEEVRRASSTRRLTRRCS